MDVCMLPSDIWHALISVYLKLHFDGFIVKTQYLNSAILRYLQLKLVRYRPGEILGKNKYVIRLNIPSEVYLKMSCGCYHLKDITSKLYYTTLQYLICWKIVYMAFCYETHHFYYQCKTFNICIRRGHIGENAR